MNIIVYSKQFFKKLILTGNEIIDSRTSAERCPCSWTNENGKPVEFLFLIFFVRKFVVGFFFFAEEFDPFDL